MLKVPLIYYRTGVAIIDDDQYFAEEVADTIKDANVTPIIYKKTSHFISTPKGFLRPV